MALCLSVCLSVTSRCSAKTDERIWLVLAWEVPSTYPTLWHKPKEIQIPSKIRILPSGTLLQTLDLEQFRHSMSIVEARYQLSSRKVDANWTFVGQLS